MTFHAPAFSYPGGKVTLRKWLVSRMPLGGRRYIEPFAGRGNVFWLASCMLAFREWHLNDPWTARWFEAVRRVSMNAIPDELTKMLVGLCKARALSHRMTDDLSVVLESRTMFSGGTAGVSRSSGINTLWKNHPSLNRFKTELARAKSILRETRPKITALEWEDLDLGSLKNDDFAYLDPPYEKATDGIYFHNTVVHSDLLRYLIQAPHLWMLSGLSSSLYSQYLGVPEATRSQKVIMTVKMRAGSKFRTECIWTNYTIGPDGVAVRKPRRTRLINKRRILL